MKRILLLAAPFVLSGWTTAARADDTNRDKTWQTVTSITAGAAMGTQVLMPRIFYSDPEVTVGWKARWHVGVLAPTMTLTVLTFLNEDALKAGIGSYRPGCNETNQGTGNCQDYGSLSSHAFFASSAFGHGVAVFLVDTYKWSDGRFNVGSFIGNAALPLVLAGVTSIGRTAGNWESGGQVVSSSLVGLGFGALTGFTYAMLARPECGYTGALICF